MEKGWPLEAELALESAKPKYGRFSTVSQELAAPEGNIMNRYETSTIVGEQGRISVAGVPFAPGTEVEITISPKTPSGNGVTHPDELSLAAARQRMQELFHSTKGFRNFPRIPREELHERGRLH